MDGQMTIFDFINEPQPGDYVKRVGKRLWFDDLRVGDLVVIDDSTQSHEWYKVYKIEKILPDAEDGGRIVVRDNSRNPGYMSRLFIDRDYAADKIFALWNGEPQINDTLDEPCRSCEIMFESLPCFDKRGDAVDFYRRPEERKRGICKC